MTSVHRFLPLLGLMQNLFSKAIFAIINIFSIFLLVSAFLFSFVNVDLYMAEKHGR